jgi:hypothetical protein
VYFHFAPTRPSWLNQVEIWFSILEAKSLHGASFTSTPDAHRSLHPGLQRNRQAVRLDQSQGPSKTPQIPSTSGGLHRRGWYALNRCLFRRC